MTNRAPLKEFIFRSALRKALKNPCGRIIPRSGEEGEGVNCFVVYVNSNGGKPYLLIDALVGDLVRCRKWDGKSFSTEEETRLQNLLNGEVEIIHYVGLYKMPYRTAWDFVWRQYTGVDRIRVGVYWGWRVSTQFLFNRRNLRSEKLLRILRLLVLRRLSGDVEGVTTYDVMTELYSTRWWDHPASKARKAGIEFQLEALVSSGDLEKLKNGISYKAAPKALRTLEEIDEQERRHTEASRLQIWLVILTLIMALAAVAQTGTIRLPTLIDWTK